ncbi:MAG: TonB-dependent receptor, partial [Hyphomicrobium sp.]
MFTFASRGRSARSRARQAQRLCKAPRIVSNFGAYVVASCLATSVSYAALVGMARLEALHAQDAGGAPAENAAPSNDAPSDVLPEVTVETSPAPAPTPKPVAPKKNTEAYVEDDEPAPRPAKKAAKKVAQPKPAAPPPESYDDAPPESADADPSANGEGVVVGITPAQPNAIDGYVATRTSTATKTNTPLRDVPQSISVVSRQQAEDQNSKDVYKALQYVPGVVMGQGEGHRDAPTIRGQSTTADFFVNGVRDDVQYFRDLYNVSSLEVLKGPTAMVFGRGGGGGVINRVTKQADGEAVREVTVTAGSFDTKRTTVDVGGAITGASAVRLNAMYEDSGSFRDFV